jgi:hypothetical protein
MKRKIVWGKVKHSCYFSAKTSLKFVSTKKVRVSYSPPTPRTSYLNILSMQFCSCHQKNAIRLVLQWNSLNKTLSFPFSVGNWMKDGLGHWILKFWACSFVNHKLLYKNAGRSVQRWIRRTNLSSSHSFSVKRCMEGLPSGFQNSNFFNIKYIKLAKNALEAKNSVFQL